MADNKSSSEMDKDAFLGLVYLNIDQMIAKLKLKALGIKIDTLTAEQKKYLSSWEMGT